MARCDALNASGLADFYKDLCANSNVTSLHTGGRASNGDDEDQPSGWLSTSCPCCDARVQTIGGSQPSCITGPHSKAAHGVFWQRCSRDSRLVAAPYLQLPLRRNTLQGMTLHISNCIAAMQAWTRSHARCCST